MGKERKKYERGAATLFITRNQAKRRLQLSLTDFRRLCILKGIYPHEPRNKRSAGKGNRAPHTYYYLKDIQYISHEPIIRTFRAFKIYMRRMKKAKDKKFKGAVRRLETNKPTYVIDHIVRERYPAFIDAVRDLDDCLTLCFLYATFPKNKAYVDVIKLCRRLSVEFMHYIIASRSLRKVFVSIKGTYYQAEVMGQQVTWIVPHKRGFVSPVDVDFKIMDMFVQFYTAFLGFVNYQLYQTLNLHYPPAIGAKVKESTTENTDESVDCEMHEEMLAALAIPIESQNNEPMDENIDDHPIAAGELNEETSKAEEELKQELKQRKMFEGLKFFLNREVPHEELTFMIRCFGGAVSWHDTSAVGAPYPETDETITHQIVDRPSVEKQYLSRYYVQPQWVFDSINARRLLPVSPYFIGVYLPPHLSPFVVESTEDYRPREKHDEFVRKQDIDVIDEDVGDINSDEEADETTIPEKATITPPKKVKGKDLEQDKKESNEKVDRPPRKMEVVSSKVRRENARLKREADAIEEKKLAELMIPKKKKRLYNKIMKSRKMKTKETRALEEKRKLYEKSEIQKKAKRLRKKKKVPTATLR